MGINHETYLLHQAYDRAENIQDLVKVWVVYVDGSQIVDSMYDLNAATALYNVSVDEADMHGNFKVELGWINENDFDLNDEKYTYRLFNVTETFEI